jgi:hypothetical protein
MQGPNVIRKLDGTSKSSNLIFSPPFLTLTLLQNCFFLFLLSSWDADLDQKFYHAINFSDSELWTHT